MVCREALVGGTETLGMETVRAFGSAYWFGPVTKLEGPWVAPLFTAGILFYLSILTIRSGYTPGHKPSLLRSLIAAYIGITGIVELTRFVWDVSRFALVWAALHNLAEWGVIGFAVFKKDEADRHWWRSQLWILIVSQWILFAPTLEAGGLGEQLVGLLCDWLLVWVWYQLWHRSSPEKRKYVKFGLIGAAGHMAEILPLVSLLIGLVRVPSIPGCLVISLTTPITFYFYHRLPDALDESGDDDPVSYKDNAKPALNIPIKQFALWVFLAFLASCATILGPAKAIPICPTKDMAVSPGQTLDAPSTALPLTGALTNTRGGVPISGQISGGSSGGSGHIDPSVVRPAEKASNETLCPSYSALTGTTVITAKPGLGKRLREMVATMPGPIRQEDGCRFYEEAATEDGQEIRFFESWTSIRSLYKHIYTSPTVRSVFFSEAFKNLLASQSLQGPFQSLKPCSEVEAEAKPVTLSFSAVIDAPVDCLWQRIDNWSGDHSWVQNSLGITPLTPALRVLHFKTTNVPVIRQTAPLPEPEQPVGGHRLVYYMLGGGFMDTVGEVYRGDLAIVPSATDPTKTVLTYNPTLVAKTQAQTKEFETIVYTDFTNNRVPFLQQWGRDTAATPACKALPPPTPTAAPAAASEWFYTFKLAAGAAPPADATSLLQLLLSKAPSSAGPKPEALYAANIGKRNFPSISGIGPDLKTKAWDVAVVVKFPAGASVRPADVGAGVTTDRYAVQVRSKPLPSKATAALCPDNAPGLAEAEAEVKEEVDAMFGNFRKWYQLAKDDPTNPNLPVPVNEPMSGINLLKYRPGPLGARCYQRYLLEAYDLIHSLGGGLYYFAEVVQDPAQPPTAQWDEIIIPLYNSGNVFFGVVFSENPSYYKMLTLRDATLRGGDQANIDVKALPGTQIAIP